MARKRLKKAPLGLLLAVFIFATIIAATVYYCSTAPRPKQPTVSLYLTRGDELVAVERPLLPKEEPLSRAVAELLAGPTEQEKAAGLSTLIPGGTRVLHLRIKDKVAIIDFNRKLENYGGGSARIEGVIAQIVYTATAIPGVDKAWIRIEGNKEIVLGGEGLVLDKPLGRADLGR
jgi:spore germination protein GerM